MSIATYLAVHHSLGQTQTRVGDLAGARTTLETAIAKGFDGDSISKEMRRRRGAGEVGTRPSQLALSACQQALLDEPEGRSEEAEHIFEQALSTWAKADPGEALPRSARAGLAALQK